LLRKYIQPVRPDRDLHDLATPVPKVDKDVWPLASARQGFFDINDSADDFDSLTLMAQAGCVVGSVQNWIRGDVGSALRNWSGYD
jgi:hypothetical protein